MRKKSSLFPILFNTHTHTHKQCFKREKTGIKLYSDASQYVALRWWCGDTKIKRRKLAGKHVWIARIKQYFQFQNFCYKNKVKAFRIKYLIRSKITLYNNSVIVEVPNSAIWVATSHKNMKV